MIPAPAVHSLYNPLPLRVGSTCDLLLVNEYPKKKRGVGLHMQLAPESLDLGGGRPWVALRYKIE